MPRPEIAAHIDLGAHFARRAGTQGESVLGPSVLQLQHDIGQDQRRCAALLVDPHEPGIVDLYERLCEHPVADAAVGSVGADGDAGHRDQARAILSHHEVGMFDDE